MHPRRQLFHRIKPFIGPMSVLSNKLHDLLKQEKITVLAWTFRRMLCKEGYNLLRQLLSITHLKPITKAMIWSVIALDINFATPKELSQFVKKTTIFRTQLETEAWFDLGPTTLRVIEMNSKASFTIHQTQNIIGRQHQVSPFRRRSYYGIS